MEVLAVLVNGKLECEYHRSRSWSDHQQSYLAKMDTLMNRGVILAGRAVRNPDPLRRAQYIARQLTNAISAENEPVMATTCAYLAKRIPAILTQAQPIVVFFSSKGLLARR